MDSHVRLCKMNMAIHGLSGDIREGNTYYEDVFNKCGQFDFVMANPPFNVNNVDKEAIKDDPRYPFGIPSPDNANYLWIQVFYSMLTKKGRAGFVMANSAADARYSEQEIRYKMIEEGIIDVVISVPSNFFYTVTLPVTLWFIDKGKREKDYKNTVLFVDARKIFSQIDRAHREFSDPQIEFISNIVRLYRGREPEIMKCSTELMKKYFPEMKYHDIKGLCKCTLIEDIMEKGWSLNPGRYVGVADGDASTYDFNLQIDSIYEKLYELNQQSIKLEQQIMENLKKIRDVLN